MERRLVGRVAGLMRYPVKSMLGEELSETDITVGGVVGDRAWALREIVTGKIVSAKKFARMFEFRASYDSPPSADASAPVTIQLPDGKKIHASDPDASEIVSAALGRKVRLERPDSAKRERAGIDPATVFGDVPVEKVQPAFTLATLPDDFGLSRGTFFDSAIMHVIATGTLRHLARLAPGSVFDARRFRASILVDTGDKDDDFIEDGWLDGILEVGETMRVAKMRPALRCVMTTHPQDDLVRDLAILRTAAFHHRANVGVFAAVGAPGKVRVGDPVYLSS
jgi:uncharacterized protein